MTSRWEADIQAKMKDLQDALYARDEWNRRIIQLQADLKNLNALHMQDVVQQQQQSLVGLTEAIRSVVRLSNTPLTAAEVKDRLDWMGFDFSSFKNASAAVHNTLKRMVEQRELVYLKGTKAYAQGVSLLSMLKRR